MLGTLEVIALCLCVPLACKNIGVGIVERWMYGESWLAMKDLKPTISSSQGWAFSVHFNLTVALYSYGLVSCMCFVSCCVGIPHCVFCFFLSFL